MTSVRPGRIARLILLVCLVWCALSWYGTSGPKQFIDCYEVAIWNGRVFVGTDVWKCLK